VAGAGPAVSSGAGRLERDFFARPAPLVARELLGARLVHLDGGVRRVVRIVEAEGYHGRLDRASHAFRGPTPRAAIMFGPPGVAYVYLIYGQYFCLNVVTGAPGEPSAVLLRAAEPLQGCLGSTRGPGNLCRALAITRDRHNGLDLGGATLYFERERAGLAPGTGLAPPAGRIVITPRVNVTPAGPRAAARRWRFVLAPSAWVSGPDRRRHAPRPA